ncbi:MAG: hypothetical protein U1A78_30745 [Polyangia bacterium]
MGKDITVRVTGQNADGSFTVQPVGGDQGNPFASGGSSSTAMTPYTPQVPASQGYRASVFGADVYYLSEADFLKADRAAREYMAQRQPGPTLGGIGGIGGIGGLGGMGTTAGFLRTGANAADTMAAFLNSRDIRRRIDDLDDALADSRSAMIDLDNIERTNTTLAPLIPVLRRLFLAERDATESSVSVLESQLTAVDIQTGAGVARVASDLMERSAGTSEGSGIGTAVAVGGAALGAGLLLSRDERGGRRRRR